MNTAIQKTASGSFFRALLCDESGVPDEANLAFLAALAELAIGAFVPHFPLGAFAVSVCAIIPLYRVSRGDLQKPSPAGPVPEAEPASPPKS